MTRTELEQILAERDAQTTTLDGLDSAMIGIHTDDKGNIHVVYSEQKIVDALIEQGMTDDEALDWYSYNTRRAIPYAGECAPIVIEP